MTNLTKDQITQLNQYSIYVDIPKKKLFTLATLLDPAHTEDALLAVQTVCGAKNKTVAASYFSRRIGMFIALQFYHLAVDHKIWNGLPERLVFGAKEEYGHLAVSTFANEADWISVENIDRPIVIKHILTKQSDAIIRQIRGIANISSLTLWENIFGFLLWQYHVLLANPSTADIALADLALLKNDELWKEIAPHSLFSTYLKGSEPAELLNTTVRTTCCLSKDVPGLTQCGFCPLKRQ